LLRELLPLLLELLALDRLLALNLDLLALLTLGHPLLHLGGHLLLLELGLLNQRLLVGISLLARLRVSRTIDGAIAAAFAVAGRRVADD